MTGLGALPAQIVVTSQLDGDEHAALKILSKNAKEADVRRFLENAKEYKTQGDLNNANAVLQVSVSANEELYSAIRRDSFMCQALMDLMKDEIDERVKKEREEAREEAREETREEVITDNIKSLMSSLNLSEEQAMDALNIPKEKRQIFIVNLNS